MVRAAATGAVDFARFDSRDTYWWRKLYWITDELGNTERRRVAEMRHAHWSALCLSTRLSREGWEKTLTSADNALSDYIKLALPWVAEKVTTTAAMTSREDAVAQWRSIWGNPGDPQYEEMMEHNRKVFAALDESDTRRRRRMAAEQETRDGLRTTS